MKKPSESISARTSPNISPNVTRRGQYQLSMAQRQKKTVQFGDRFNQNYSSDPNLSKTNKEFSANLQIRNLGESSTASNTVNCQSCQSCNCKTAQRAEGECVSNSSESLKSIPIINVESCDNTKTKCCTNCEGLMPVYGLKHKLVQRLTAACSLADLKNAAVHDSGLSKSLNNVNIENRFVSTYTFHNFSDSEHHCTCKLQKTRLHQRTAGFRYPSLSTKYL